MIATTLQTFRLCGLKKATRSLDLVVHEQPNMEGQMDHLPKVLIIELGSQYTLLIERSLRELGVRSVILDPRRAQSFLRENRVKAIILSGGAASVYENDAPQPPEEVLSAQDKFGRMAAILGICYGMQWLALRFGGEVEPVTGNREYGEASIEIRGVPNEFFSITPQIQKVWMSH